MVSNLNQDNNTGTTFGAQGAVSGGVTDDTLVNPTTPAETVTSPSVQVPAEPQFASSIDAHMANQASPTDLGAPSQSVPVTPSGVAVDAPLGATPVIVEEPVSPVVPGPSVGVTPMGTTATSSLGAAAVDEPIAAPAPSVGFVKKTSA